MDDRKPRKNLSADDALENTGAGMEVVDEYENSEEVEEIKLNGRHSPQRYRDDEKDTDEELDRSKDDPTSMG